MRLPIEEVLGEVREAMASAGRAVLVAPPGAGKTTRVPLALLEAELGPVVMLEPRRLAARAAAGRMADALGEPVGRTVGYAVRGERKTSDATRIEVVTEGILVRRIQRDPGLEGVGCVVLDEFHERSLDADLALALCLEARELREDLRVLVMSATLAAEPVAALMGGAPVVRSEGRMFPVETRWGGTEGPVWEDVARLVPEALEHGPVLAFLPGAGEIGRCAERLSGLGVPVQRLFGAMPLAEQRAVVAPHDGPRVVLATSIAETSLTVPGIRAVVDGGLARRSRHDPGSGMSRLVTERASRAEADQRRGRAGREAPGLCLRAWTKGQEGAMPAQAPPEMLTADLTGLALQMADWGASALPFLDAPPEGAMAEAEALLGALGALDGGITAHGRAMARLPLHPRLAHMLLTAGKGAADLAALLSEGDPLRSLGVDAGERLKRMRSPEMGRVRTEAARLRRMAPDAERMGDGAAASLAYPNRIGLRRPGGEARWLLSGGKGARMDGEASLAGQRLIVALDTDGAREAKVRLALPVTEGEVRGLHPVRTVRVADWSKREGRVVSVEREMLGALVLSEKRWDAPGDALAAAALDGLREVGMPWRGKAARLRARAALAGVEPDGLDEAGDWVLPWLEGARTAANLRALDLTPALEARLGWDAMERLRREVPEHFVTPLGRKVPIDYGGEAPTAEIQVKELYGVTVHPTAAGVPLRLSLLSPGGKPVAVTSDLPGFWDGAWEEVRKEMRGRYPRHLWPEDPREAEPTVRAKRRG